MIAYNYTPVHALFTANQSDLEILIKREDLNHPSVSGNKWWKMKHNLEQAISEGKKTILTFGGAYSNHIYATAAAAHESGLQSIGIIRGEETLPLNATLTFAKSKGMQLHYVSREAYREKNSPEFIADLRNRFGDFYLIPEGGTNSLALKGCEELGAMLLNENDFDYLMLPVATGGTMAGIIAGLKGRKQVIGISVLKNGEFLEKEIKTLLEKNNVTDYGNWEVLTSYDHGGYAKVTSELMEFIHRMKAEHDLPLDMVYTGKLLWAVEKEMERGRFAKGSTVLVLHTGGLQGASYSPS